MIIIITTIKLKPLHIMLPKTRAYVKSYDEKLNECIFWLKMISYWKNVIVFWINSELILKNNFIANSPPIKKFLKTKIKSYGDEATDFHDK